MLFKLNGKKFHKDTTAALFYTTSKETNVPTED